MYINETKTKRFLLEYAKQNRAHKFNRVSKETLRMLDERHRREMIAHVASFPSRGKTL